MLRITQMMQTLAAPGQERRASPPSAPVVIWNLIRRCNLCCEHCYSISADRDFPGELSTAEVFAVLEDLAAFGVPALILSGGEPLLRPDLFEVTAKAKSLGMRYVGLSTNGTAIDTPMADRIASAGFDYVGISLDGRPETHDRVRRQAGAYDLARRGLRLMRDRGVKVGIRFTLTERNAADLDHLLGLMETESIDRFYLSHLNYGGRGNVNRGRDALHESTRRSMTRIFDACWAGIEAGRPREFTSGNNDADGVFLLQWAQARMPERAGDLQRRLEQWGGNATGVAIANIDNLGNVHPDTYWWDHRLGNVRLDKFSDIWRYTNDPLMLGLRTRPRPVKGRCAACAHLAICGGNTRVRALQVTGDPWEEDPGCYLTDAEIGIEEGARRVTVTPYRRSALEKARA
jgi:heme d1 biosynthesis radical SAM protein NirJ